MHVNTILFLYLYLINFIIFIYIYLYNKWEEHATDVQKEMLSGLITVVFLVLWMELHQLLGVPSISIGCWHRPPDRR